MLKKASLIAKLNQEIPIKFKVSKYTYPDPGYDAYEMKWGKYSDPNGITAIPYWTNLTTDGSRAVLTEIYHIKGKIPNYVDESGITLSVTGDVYDTSKSIQATINGTTLTMRPRKDGFVADAIPGDPWNLDGSLGKTLLVTFTPPLPDIYKKVKQVFTRTLREGVVNAWEGNAYRVGYTRKGKYHQRHRLHCTGDPRWKFSLDYTSWQDRKGQRTYRGCGIYIFPRFGWKITRACHHEHIEKYITHWLYRFPSKAPNGRLIRKYLLNLGVTSQLEVPYAA